MKNMNFRRIVLSFVAFGSLMAAQAVMMDSALAKSAHCSAVPVPGQPGHYIVVCSRTRP